MRLILGSQSPRRKEILNYFAIPFVQIPSAFDEESIAFRGDPSRYVQELSQKKAQELAPRFPGDAILTADTVVFLNGKIYNKPKDEGEGRHVVVFRFPPQQQIAHASPHQIRLKSLLA